MPTGQENTASKQYSVRVPWDLSDKIEAYALKHQTSPSRAVIELLTKGLESTTPSTLESTTPPEGSALEARLGALEAKLEAFQVAAAQRQPEGVEAKALEYLRACRAPQRAGDIAAALGGPRTTISSALQRLVAAGKVRQDGARGPYELADG